MSQSARLVHDVFESEGLVTIEVLSSRISTKMEEQD